jgi:phenylalanyl-tRNA synthetase beta chain
MKASVHWLRSLVPGLSASAAEIANRFTAAGLEVEAITEFGLAAQHVRVASVTDVQPHPSRANLQLVSVNMGGGNIKTVVCGAPNVPAAGGLVCLAQIGATLPAVGLTLTERDFDGVRSEGMLCSEAELGIGDDRSGILVLDPGAAPPGTLLSEAVAASRDTVLEIGVTPNRPDALGHIGLARDLAALFELAFNPPSADSPVSLGSGTIEQRVAIEVRDYERCPHYGALVVEDVVIGPSPWWLKLRLTSLGVRPVCNIVDITNLLMLEYGHPMHAFDLDLIRGPKIIVRRAEPGEKMKTLDAVERALNTDDLLICDAQGPVALGGVMGGENTEIRPTTCRVLFECATFNPRGIRRTARRHGLHTESSHRFERGVDPGDVHDVLAQAGSLATRFAHAKAIAGAIHARRDPLAVVQVQLRQRRLNELLGVQVPFDEAKQILARLGFGPTELHAPEGRQLVATVPSHRADISLEADLIDEVARVRGLDAIPTVIPPIRPQEPRDTLVLESRVRAAAVQLGLSEALTYGFVSTSDLQRVGAPQPSVTILNPLTEDRSVMRTSLLPGLLETMARAQRRGERSGRLFTLGAVFLPPEQADLLPQERPSFAAILVGSREPWLGRAEDVDLYDAKAIATQIIERVLRRADMVTESFASGSVPKHLHPRAAAAVHVGGLCAGRFGLLHPDVTDAYEIAGASAAVEMDLDVLRKVGPTPLRYRAIPRVPAATRDISLVVPDDCSSGRVRDVIREAAGELCESIEIFDVFRGAGIPQGHRSLAFHVVYRDPKSTRDPDHARTLTDQEVDDRHAIVVSSARERLGASLR